MKSVKFILSCVAVLLVISSVQARFSDYVNFEKANSAISTMEVCSTYTDCFNCTLSNCDWQLDSCVDITDVNYDTPIVQAELYKRRNRCGDPLNACTFTNVTQLATMKFAKEPAESVLPAGYFCSWDINNDGADNWTVSFEQPDAANENATELIGYSYKHAQRIDTDGKSTFEVGHLTDSLLRATIGAAGQLVINPDDFGINFIVINIFERTFAETAGSVISIPHEYTVEGGVGIVAIIIIAVVVVAALLILVQVVCMFRRKMAIAKLQKNSTEVMTLKDNDTIQMTNPVNLTDIPLNDKMDEKQDTIESYKKDNA